MTQTERKPSTHTGGCHCGAVRFEADLDLGNPVGACNCTLCTKRGVLGAIVKPAELRVLAGEENLGDYSWGPKTAHFLFCKTCGIHVFGRGHLVELGGAYASVNVTCIDDIDPATLEVVYFDGRHDNWQAGVRDTPWPVHA
ncbi:MAG: aldehyde-activating protein [Myxococcales bacterium]|nr:aldehyde-activating protein [Myxococcales bacterium]